MQVLKQQQMIWKTRLEGGAAYEEATANLDVLKNELKAAQRVPSRVKRAAVYLRVSTVDQTTANQERGGANHHRGRNSTFRVCMSVPQLVFLPSAAIAGSAAIFSPP